MKKLIILISFILTACSGYQPLYGELGDKMNEIGIKSVTMENVDRNIGERRLAQLMQQKLYRVFNNTYDNDYDLYVTLDPSELAIATRADDTDKRKSVSISADVILKDTQTGKNVFQTTLSLSSSYTIQDQPFASQAARKKALESIVSSLSKDIIQRTALWFRGYTDNEDNI